jgi:hypothetical protein
MVKHLIHSNIKFDLEKGKKYTALSMDAKERITKQTHKPVIRK